jgi:hypothetical protein
MPLGNRRGSAHPQALPGTRARSYAKGGGIYGPAKSPGERHGRRKGEWKAARASNVTRAKELLKDPAYPSPRLLGSVAALLGKHLGNTAT